jgi:ketosteroid isomerase-like protein
MAPDNVEIVRKALRARERSRRTLDERLFVRWPRAYAALGSFFLLLPPRSRLRRALLRRNWLSGWSALARGDLDLMLVRFARDCELEVGPLVGVGMRSSYRGHAGVREVVADLSEAFERMELTPFEILDAGDRIVFLGHLHIRGGGSGVELDSPFAEVLWAERGLIVRDNTFFDWDAALRVAGIPTNAPGDLDLAADAGTAAAPH